MRVPMCAVASSQLPVADNWQPTTASLLFHPQRCALEQVALAPEPVFHRGAQAFQRDARTDLHFTIADGDRIVEHLVVGKVAHAETVQPLQRTRMPLASLFVLDSNLAGEHENSLEFQVSSFKSKNIRHIGICHRGHNEESACALATKKSRFLAPTPGARNDNS